MDIIWKFSHSNFMGKKWMEVNEKKSRDNKTESRVGRVHFSIGKNMSSKFEGISLKTWQDGSSSNVLLIKSMGKLWKEKWGKGYESGISKLKEVIAAKPGPMKEW